MLPHALKKGIQVAKTATRQSAMMTPTNPREAGASAAASAAAQTPRNKRHNARGARQAEEAAAASEAASNQGTSSWEGLGWRVGRNTLEAGLDVLGAGSSPFMAPNIQEMVYQPLKNKREANAAAAKERATAASMSPATIAAAAASPHSPSSTVSSSSPMSYQTLTYRQLQTLAARRAWAAEQAQRATIRASQARNVYGRFTRKLAGVGGPRVDFNQESVYLPKVYGLGSQQARVPVAMASRASPLSKQQLQGAVNMLPYSSFIKLIAGHSATPVPTSVLSTPTSTQYPYVQESAEAARNRAYVARMALAAKQQKERNKQTRIEQARLSSGQFGKQFRTSETRKSPRFKVHPTPKYKPLTKKRKGGAHMHRFKQTRKKNW